MLYSSQGNLKERERAFFVWTPVLCSHPVKRGRACSIGNSKLQPFVPPSGWQAQTGNSPKDHTAPPHAPLPTTRTTTSRLLAAQLSRASASQVPTKGTMVANGLPATVPTATLPACNVPWRCSAGCRCVVATRVAACSSGGLCSAPAFACTPEKESRLSQYHSASYPGAALVSCAPMLE